MKSIRQIIREEVGDFDWAQDIPGLPEDITDGNKYMALVELLGIDEVFGEDAYDPNTSFSENSWTHYDITTYTLDNGEEWAVGTPEEFDVALHEYWVNYVDDVGLDNINGIEEYLTMSDYDRGAFASDMAHHYVEDLGDEDLLDLSGLDEEWEELENEIDELIEEQDEEEDETALEMLETAINDLRKKQDDLIRSAKGIVYHEHYEEWYGCLEDPYECLVRGHGLYQNARDLIQYNVVMFDGDEWVEDMVNGSNWGELASWDGEYYEVSGFVLIRIN